MHEQFLLAALEQAHLGRGRCAPNPSVGAVAVQHGRIIAQNYHRGAGTAHAERLLLDELPPNLPGVSLYVTLEPCNHWGKTPPCVDALIQYGVEQVFFAYRDPNPLVAQNSSTDYLQQHGIKVHHLPLAVIDEFYRSYTHWTLTQKPFVTVKMAQSLDGKIGSVTGLRLHLSNNACAKFTHEQRAATDIILTTAKTILLDQPKMNVRLAGQEWMKPLAILDNALILPQNASIFTTTHHCHLFHQEGVSPHESVGARPTISYHPIPSKQGRLDLDALIQELGLLGYHDVWVEAGAELFRSLHQERLVNRTYLYLVPTHVGDNALDLYAGLPLFTRAHRVSWQVMEDNVIACFDWLEE